MHRLLLFLLVGCGSAGGFSDDDSNPPPGGGSFDERVIDQRIVHGQGAQAIDIDRDGDLDVVAALSLTDAVHLYLNEGRGQSWRTVEIGTGIVAMETEVADYDGDGDLDIAAVGLFDRNGGPGEVIWYENPGSVTGSWTEHPITSFASPIYVVAGDLSGDGVPDLVVGAIEYAGEGRGVWWFRNSGGAFETAVAIDAELRDAVSVQLSDVDGDGALDVVAAGRESSELAWYRNAGGTFTKTAIASLERPTDVQLGNLDADPELEVVAARANSLVYFDPPGWTEVRIGAFPSSETTRLALGDFDRDGTLDVAGGTSGGGGELRIFANARSTFSSRVVRTGYTGLNFTTAGDLDADGRPDLLTTTYDRSETSDLISWWANAR